VSLGGDSTDFLPQGLDVRDNTEVSNQDIRDEPLDASFEIHRPEETEDLDDDMNEELVENAQDTARLEYQSRTLRPNDIELRHYFYPYLYDDSTAIFFGHHRSSIELEKSATWGCYICATFWESHGSDMTRQRKLNGAVFSSTQVPLPEFFTYARLTEQDGDENVFELIIANSGHKRALSRFALTPDHGMFSLSLISRPLTSARMALKHRTIIRMPNAIIRSVETFRRSRYTRSKPGYRCVRWDTASVMMKRPNLLTIQPVFLH
jgi:hypothetical protein